MTVLRHPVGIGDDQPAPPLAWTGWHRPPGGHWRPIGQAASEHAAWDLLLDLQAAGDKLVMRSGRHPHDRTKQQRLFA
jgi:hypothetical protein